MALIRDFDNEDIAAVRSHFADTAQWRPSAFGKTEPSFLEEKVSGWEGAFAKYDFDLGDRGCAIVARRQCRYEGARRFRPRLFRLGGRRFQPPILQSARL